MSQSNSDSIIAGQLAKYNICLAMSVCHVRCVCWIVALSPVGQPF